MNHGSDPIERMTKQEKQFFLPYLPNKTKTQIPREKPNNKTTNTFIERNTTQSQIGSGSKSQHHQYKTAQQETEDDESDLLPFKVGNLTQ